MIEIVIDTSVVVKWFTQENDSDKANQLLTLISSGRTKLVLPSAAPLEVINVLRLSKNFTFEKTTEALNNFYGLEPELVDVDKIFSREIINLIYAFDLTSYDASFVTLAIARNIPFLTADYKHHNKSISPYIVWLSEWKGKF